MKKEIKKKNGKFDAAIDTNVENMESEKLPYVCEEIKKDDILSLILNDNVGINGESEQTIKTEEVSISSESVQVDNADVQDSKPEVKVLPNIVDVYALAIFEHCPYENLTQDDRTL